MNKLLALCFLFASGITHATESKPNLRNGEGDLAVKKSAQGDDPTKLIDQIDGVYKLTHKFELVDGEKYSAEDILEIVKVDNRSIYFKTKLNFDNGHQCFLFGIAQHDKSSDFNYSGEATDDGKKCKLQIKYEDNSISLNDAGGSCRELSCGARGGYDGTNFPINKRRPIKYMNLLKNSEDYKSSVKTLQKS